MNDIEQFHISKSLFCSPEECTSYIDQNSTSNTLKIIHVNIRSISCNFVQFQILRRRLQVPMDIIILSECWLSKCPTLPILTGYSSHGSKYSRQNDGVVAYIRQDLPYTIETPCFSESNALIIKNKNAFALIVIYQSPSYRKPG